MATMNRRSFFRRSFALFAAAQTLQMARGAGSVPVGLGLFAVEEEWTKDPPGTLRAIAQMGYQVVEFSGPLYFNMTTTQAKDIRKHMDDLGVRCRSTHNDGPLFTAEGLPKAIELNHTLGSKDLVVSGNRNPIIPKGGGAAALDGWKRVADQLAAVSEKLKPAGLRAGYHNHPIEFTLIDGQCPMDVIAANTPKDVMLQLCVGACLGARGDPVAFIAANPGRIRHIHCKDWAPGRDYEVLFGEGVAPWPQVFAAAESVGGVEFYLIEQLGSKSLRSLSTAQRCMANWKKLKG